MSWGGIIEIFPCSSNPFPPQFQSVAHVILAIHAYANATRNIEKYVENIVISRPDTNKGFLLNCNLAASKARGEYILIIEGSNETRPDNQDSYEYLDERAYVIKLMEEGLSKKDAIKRVAKDRKLKKDLVYKEVLDL